MITTPTREDKGTMTPRIRTALIISTLAVVLAACGAAETADPTESAVQPTPATESEAPASEAPEASVAPSGDTGGTPSGTLTVVGAAVDGPGEPLTEALARDTSEPVFARGVLWLDDNGDVWLADEVVDASVPTFSDVRVQVEGYPNDGPTWDIDDPNVTGLQEVNGVLFYEDAKIYGTVTP